MKDGISLAFPEDSNNLPRRIKNTINQYCEESTKFKKYNYSPEIYDLFTRKKDSPENSRILNEESFDEKRNSPKRNNERIIDEKNNKIIVMKFYNKQSDETISKILKGLKTDKHRNKITLNNSYEIAPKENRTNKINHENTVGNTIVAKAGMKVLQQSNSKKKLISLMNNESNNIKIIHPSHNSNNYNNNNKNKNSVLDYNQLVRNLMK